MGFLISPCCIWSLLLRRAGEGMLFPYTILFSFLFLRLRLKWLMGLKDYRGYFYGLMWVREERSCKLGPVCKLKRETVLGVGRIALKN